MRIKEARVARSCLVVVLDGTKWADVDQRPAQRAGWRRTRPAGAADPDAGQAWTIPRSVIGPGCVTSCAGTELQAACEFQSHERADSQALLLPGPANAP